MYKAMVSERSLLPVFEKVKNRKDIATLVFRAKEIWLEHYTPIIGKEQVQYMLKNLHSEDVLLDQIKNQRFSYYLIKQDDLDVGYFGIQTREKDVFLSKLYIRSDYRGTGIGGKALKYIKQKTKQKKRKLISLRVNKDNLKSIVTYYQLGFVKAGEACTSIGGSYVMDDLIMEMALD